MIIPHDAEDLLEAWSVAGLEFSVGVERAWRLFWSLSIVMYNATCTWSDAEKRENVGLGWL